MTQAQAKPNPSKCVLRGQVHETSIQKIGMVPCNKASHSLAQPSLFINTQRRGYLLEDKGGALFYQQYTLLFYQLADDTIWVGIVWCWWILCIYNEARPNWVLEDIQRIVEGQYGVYHMVLSSPWPSLVNGTKAGASQAESTSIPTIQRDKLQSLVETDINYFISFIISTYQHTNDDTEA